MSPMFLPRPTLKLLSLLVLLLFASTPLLAAKNLLTPYDPRPQAKEFSLLTLEGKAVELAKKRGKVLVINFWATWCPACLHEMPSFNRAAEWLEPHGAEVIGINVGESAQRVQQYLDKNPLDFTILMDPLMEVSIAWDAIRLPVTFIVDPDGRIAYRALGAREWDSGEMLVPIRTLSILK